MNELQALIAHAVDIAELGTHGFCPSCGVCPVSGWPYSCECRSRAAVGPALDRLVAQLRDMDAELHALRSGHGDKPKHCEAPPPDRQTLVDRAMGQAIADSYKKAP